MLKPNSIEFELPYDEGLLLQLRGEWIAEQKMEGIRAVLEYGVLKTPHTNLRLPGPVPSEWKHHAFDGCLVGEIYYLFDVLTLDGEDTRRRPLFERRTLLRSVALPSWCRLVPCGKNIGEFLEAVIRDGGKGIVLKNLLERYGNAEWIKVEPPETVDVVVTAVHRDTLSVTVGQFRGNALVDCGLVFLGSLVPDARVGEVLEIAVGGRDPQGVFQRTRFVRFRPEKLAAHCSQPV